MRFPVQSRSMILFDDKCYRKVKLFQITVINVLCIESKVELTIFHYILKQINTEKNNSKMQILIYWLLLGSL